MIRIDMLERLADMLRAEDSRGGFEAKADMLSITGMTLEQFADLMQGLGYRAEKGERVKVKAAPEAPKEASKADAPEAATEIAEAKPEDSAAIVEPAEAPAATEVAAEEKAEAPVEETPEAATDTPAETPAEMEVFYTFAWGGRARQGGGNRGQRRGQGGQQGQGGEGATGQDGQDRRGGKPRGQGRSGERAGGKPGGRPGGKPGGKKGGRPQQQGSKTYSARPPKKEKQIDPDNPFAAALMGLKQGD